MASANRTRVPARRQEVTILKSRVLYALRVRVQFALFALFGFLAATGPARPAELALTGGTVYAAPGAPALRDAVVVIKDGRISAIGSRADVAVPKTAKVVDCSRKFLVAGYWNSHVHILTPPLLQAREAAPSVLNPQLEQMFNRWGFTTVFDIASVLKNTLALRGRIDKGELRGPRILTVGEPLWTTPPVYVRDFLVANQVEIMPVKTPEAAAERVRALAQGGANGIKLFVGSMQGIGQVENMPLDLIRAASAEARRLRLPVFAHPQNLKGLETAIDGGVQILAHTAPDSPAWTPAFVKRLTTAGIALIPTLTLFDVEGRKADIPEAQRVRWIDGMVAQLRAFAQGGGEVLFGTDIGYIDHFDTAMEFASMGRAGLSFNDVLASLTTNPAHRFGFAERRGRLLRGWDADIVVLDEDPARDVVAFSKVRMTIRSGELIYQAN